jgi:hypothetical protein
MIENITLFTDASFDDRHRIGGGAYWSRMDEVKLKGSFAFDIPKSHEAEIMAACMGILRVAAHPTLGAELARGPETRLVLVTDCLAVQQVLQDRKSGPLSTACQQIVSEVLFHKDRLNFGFKVNHVTAHSGLGTPRQWVNDWCDREAKARMRELRQTRISEK